MREPVKKIIDGEQYTFYQLNPKLSLKLLVRILRLIGTPAGAALSNAENLESLFNMTEELDFGIIVTKLCERLDENEVEYIVDTILSQTMHEGRGEVSKQAAFNDIFGGKIGHLFKVVFAALEVEYGDFFGEGLGLQNIFKGRAMTQEKQTSIGSSGGQSSQKSPH